MIPAQHLKRLTRILAVSFLLSILGYAFVIIPFDLVETARLKTSDIFFRVAHALRPLPKEINDIAIVAIDDVSLQQVGRRWPWDRDIYATMVNNIKGANPKVIGFDIIFIGESVNKSNDEKFREAIKEAGNVVLASYYSDLGESVIPYRPFAEAAVSYGLINKPRDRDSRVRSTRLFIKPDKDVEDAKDYSFETKVLSVCYGCPPGEIVSDGKSIAVKRGKNGQELISLPVDKDGAAKINFLADEGDFKIIPAWRIVNGQFSADELKDKIVLLGQTNEIIHDVYPTPLSEMPGVLINANGLLTALSGRFIKTVPPLADSFILIFFCAIALFLSYKFSALKGLMSILLEILSFFAAAAALFSRNIIGDFFSVPLCVVIIYIAVIIYKYVRLMVESMDLKQDAITDGLTGLFILRYFTGRIQNEFERAKRYNLKLSLVMMDIDHFKKFNDRYGHEQGNVVLKGFAEIMKDTFRKSDILARYGGEEFCALLPGVGRGEAFESAERFRRKLQSVPFHIRGVNEKVTASIGVVSFPDTFIDTSENFVEFADKALYEAKNSGRNKTVYYK